jgi:hypothetical protein
MEWYDSDDWGDLYEVNGDEDGCILPTKWSRNGWSRIYGVVNLLFA